MKVKLTKYKSYVINLLVPALVFGFLTGTITAVIVALYKLCAKYVIQCSEHIYAYLRGHLYLLPVVIVGLFGVGLLLAYIYKKIPNVKGGGIPASVGILRGIITFKWLRSLIGTFMLSLTTFLLGVPLGNEGPSVQMGTAIGRGSVYIFAKKHRAWDRYSMTGGACAGFSVATGAPISGILFAIEEAHQRISPTIVIMASSSVLFASITSKLLSPVLGVSEKMFAIPNLPELDVREYWLPLLVGLAVGLFGVLFLHYYKLISKLHGKTLSKVPHFVKIFVILLLTLIMGLVSQYNVSTGHELIVKLFENHGTAIVLLLILAVRSTLTISASASGITGGTFVPILATGALVASALGELLLYIGLDPQLYTVIIVLGIAACISGSMKMPLTAIIFSIEALSGYENILPIVITSFIAFLVTEAFGVKSINDVMIENRMEDEECGQTVTVDTYVTVKEGAFAIGKQIRDIFWPRNLFVLSLKHPASSTQVDEHGGKEIRQGDILHVRYTAKDSSTKEELLAIVGEQKIEENIAKTV